MARSITNWSTLLFAAVLTIAGCHGKKEPEISDFKKVINDHYSTNPECVWTAPTKLPAQADASDDRQTKAFDALTDAGLLTRKPEEKSRFLIGSKQVNDYDLSDKGRAAWTANQSQPGYGNFCFGHREVTSIDGVTTATNSNGTNIATVTYHYDVIGVPEWAKLPETKNAFPNIQTALAGPRQATSTLVQTSNGWQLATP
jgi:hypothetical protein